MTEKQFTDTDGRSWVQEDDGSVFSPSHGLEFETLEELADVYGPLTEDVLDE